MRKKPTVKLSSKEATDPLSGLPDMPPAFLDPMQAKLVDCLPEGDLWRYELKLDGFRALAIKTAAGVQLISQNQKSLTECRYRQDFMVRCHTTVTVRVVSGGCHWNQINGPDSPKWYSSFRQELRVDPLALPSDSSMMKRMRCSQAIQRRPTRRTYGES
jgi:hypothetical protein